MTFKNQKSKIVFWNKYDWKQFALGTFLGILTSACGAGLPFLIQKIEMLFNDNQVQKLSNSQTTNQMIYVVLFMLLIGIVGLITSFFSKVFLSKLSARKIAQVRSTMYANIQDASFYDLNKYSHGSLISRLTTDVYNFSIYYNWLLINVIPSALRWIIFLIMTFVLNYIIGFILFGFSIILYLVSYVFSKKSINYFEPSLEKLDKLNLISQENIINSRIIRAFNLFDRQSKRFSKTNKEYETLTVKAETKAFLSWPFAIAFVNASAIIIVLVSTQMSWSGIDYVGTKIDVGTIYAIFSYAYLILWSVYDYVFLYVYDSRSNVSRKRIKEILNLRNTIKVENKNDYSHGKIKFLNVSFKFNKNVDEYVLKNINFEINKNAKIGIIGTTGSGKTTLLNLIARLYESTSGDILINETNINEINTHSLLENISIAFQSKNIFSGTIKENLLMANEKANDFDINEVIKVAQLDHFVKSNSEGINYKLEEYGQNLSGGQKQRVNIARALIRKANIYIFDDSMSALDNITEQKVLKGIFERTKNSTLIISSQKISTIKDMDQIIVLDKGEISAIGTHDKLIKSNKIYKEIYELQTQGDEYE